MEHWSTTRKLTVTIIGLISLCGYAWIGEGEYQEEVKIECPKYWYKSPDKIKELCEEYLELIATESER